MIRLPCLESIDQSLGRANQLVRGKKYDDARAALDEAAASLETLRSTNVPDDLQADVEAAQKRLTTAERAIAKRKTTGAKPAATAKQNKKDASSKKASAKNRGANQAGPANQGRPPAPQFSTDVAPILMARCGNCHINAAPGGLNMASFAALARGARWADHRSGRERLQSAGRGDLHRQDAARRRTSQPRGAGNDLLVDRCRGAFRWR